MPPPPRRQHARLAAETSLICGCRAVRRRGHDQQRALADAQRQWSWRSAPVPRHGRRGQRHGGGAGFGDQNSNRAHGQPESTQRSQGSFWRFSSILIRWATRIVFRNSPKGKALTRFCSETAHTFPENCSYHSNTKKLARANHGELVEKTPRRRCYETERFSTGGCWRRGIDQGLSGIEARGDTPKFRGSAFLPFSMSAISLVARPHARESSSRLYPRFPGWL